VLGSIRGIGGCAQLVRGLGLNPDMDTAPFRRKKFCMAIGVCYLMLVSMNLVILFTNGGHWVLWK